MAAKLANRDIGFIKKNYDKLSIDELAERVGKDRELVRVQVNKLKAAAPVKAETIQAERDLLKSPEWTLLEKEFSTDELQYFKHRYSKLMAQLKEDVTATEETQVMTLVKYELLKHRNLADVKSMAEDIDALEERLDAYISSKDPSDYSDEDKKFITAQQMEITSIRQARQAKSVELNEYDKRSSAIMKDLKTLREQRLAKNENAAGSVLQLLKIMNNPLKKAEKGRAMEMMRIAAEKEKVRLSQNHQYLDGEVDQPILTPETSHE